MKAVSMTIYLIVAAVVILITALVILTIFGTGIQPIVDITTQRSICLQQGTISCQTTGELPPTWKIPMKVNEGGKIVEKSCSEITNCYFCIDNKLNCGKVEKV
jgi:disulfide bond formation protein DsbB